MLLAAGALLPLAVMAGVALQALLDQQRLQTEQSSLDLTRAMATAVDAELRLTVSALQSLAATEPQAARGRGDIESLYEVARRVVDERPEWRTVLLAEPNGRIVFSTAFPLTDAPPPLVDPESFGAAVASRAPTIGGLSKGPLGEYGVPVRIPMFRGNDLAYILTAIVKPEGIQQVLLKQRVPSDWVVSVFDAKNVRVARSRDHEKLVGSNPAPSLVALQKSGDDEGTGRTLTVEGDPVFTAFTRLKPTGWTVTIGLPAAVAESAWHRSALAYGGGILLSLGIGSLAAWLVARSIARPIDRLRKSAIALGRGEAPPRDDASLVEIQAASDALVNAAERRIRAEQERERLLEAERNARTLAEQARRRLELLAGAGSMLSRSLEEQSTLDSIASVVVPGIADWCRIDLMDEDGNLQRKLTHHLDPQRRAAVEAWVAQHQTSAETPGAFPQVIATGKPHIANYDDDAVASTDPTFAEFRRVTGMRAVCAVPLVARGRTIGAMAALQAESGRRFAPEDGLLLIELAQRAALALDNVRLFAESVDALHEAEVANRSKDDFLAMLGHELRNPLAPIVTSLAVMARHPGDASGTQRLVIERQVAHLSSLVDDLLDVSRIVSGKVRLKLECVDMRSVVRQALELVEPALQQRRQPDISLPAEPAWVWGDAVRLAQVLGNLLTNAAKFSAPEDRVAIALSVDAGEVRVEVLDEGAGIAPHLLGRVFERFVQGEQALQRAEGGLGLAIARNLVELHHGRISAHSAGLGRGSRFVVTLPQAAAGPVAERDAGSARGTTSSRVLLVDDNVDAVETLAELLRMEGYEVLATGSAEQALERVEGFAPQVAVLDIGLPKMNGFDLARALRANARLLGVRLIALTGYGRAPDRDRALEAGFDEHMVKPAPIDELLAKIA
ncbi:MAG: ATP-binding protein, partial [Caldimonas sp.]